jgi:hypothetical protein
MRAKILHIPAQILDMLDGAGFLKLLAQIARYFSIKTSQYLDYPHIFPLNSQLFRAVFHKHLQQPL